MFDLPAAQPNTMRHRCADACEDFARRADQCNVSRSSSVNTTTVGGGRQCTGLLSQRPIRRARAGGRRGRYRRCTKGAAGVGAAQVQFRGPGLTCAHNAYVELLTGFGLATAAGLNAYIPLLALGLLSRFTDLVTLPAGWAWLENGWVMAIVAVLLAVEIVADKIPALDSVNDTIQTFIRPTAGGIVFGSGTAAQTSAVADPGAFAQSGQWIPVAIGVVTALVVSLTKSAARPVANVATAGVAAPVLSTIEDATSVGLVLVALLVPALVLVVVVALVWGVVRVVRRRRRDAAAESG